MNKNGWKIGELAKRTGLTVRALHHYDQKGLVTPSKSAESGHRLYTEADIARLQQVVSLKQLGFTLEQIKALIESDEYDPVEVLGIQMDRLREAIRVQEQLYGRLEDMHTLLAGRKHVTTELFMKTMEAMNMNPNQYFTEEQLERLKKQSEKLGPDKIREVENEWPELIAKVRAEMEKGTPVGHPDVVQLAKRWKQLMELFSGGDGELVKAAERFHADNPGNSLQNGVDGELYIYISQAVNQI